MAWSVSWDGSVMMIVVALKLPNHYRNVTQWFRAIKWPSGEWSQLMLVATTGNYTPLSTNERRALLRAARKEMRDALKQIAEGVQSSL